MSVYTTMYKFNNRLPASLLTLVSISLACLALLMLVAEIRADEEHIEVAFKDVTLKDVCANRQVPIVSVEVAKKMIAELIANPSLCPESYRQSIYELEPVLMVTKGEKICGERKFNQIADYHFRYVNPKRETYRFFDDLDHLPQVIKKEPLTADKIDYGVQLDDYKQEILIPIAMQQFFKAWVLQVSGMCKLALVDNLKRAIETTMSDEDLHLMDHVLKTEKEKVGSSGGRTKKSGDKTKKVKTSSFGGIVYMPELEGRSADDDRVTKGPAVLDFTDDPQMNNFMHACLLRYKPIYSKLIIPIVRLAKLGYDYMGREIESISGHLAKDPTINRWLALTSICESHGDFELVDSPSSSSSLEMEQLSYEPTISYGMDNNMWIKGADALQNEFDKIKGQKATGWKGLRYKLGRGGRKAVAFIDPHQFGWYRRNQNTVANILNTMSIAWNTISVGVSVGLGR